MEFFLHLKIRRHTLAQESHTLFKRSSGDAADRHCDDNSSAVLSPDHRQCTDVTHRNILNLAGGSDKGKAVWSVKMKPKELKIL